VLRAGPSAVLSHESAAELYGMATPGTGIHVTIPAGRKLRPVPGLAVHRSTRIDQARHPVLQPPRTRIDETTIDLTQEAARFDDAFAWLCRSVGQGLTTASRLRAAVDARPKIRWRADLGIALGDIESGARSVLELRYVRDVERAHGLPKARRQVKVVTATRTRYLDNLYEAAGVVVELDGRAAHPAAERWLDIHRDNCHAGSGLVTLRYSWPDIALRPCTTAGQVAQVLRSRGVRLTPRPCGPSCDLQRP
jgi:hypothetical protein